MLEGDTEGRVGIDARHADVEVARLGRAHQVLIDAQPLGVRVRVRLRVRVGVGGTLTLTARVGVSLTLTLAP